MSFAIEANGVTVVGLQFFPKDANGDFVSGAVLSLEGTGCGSLDNIVEDAANEVITFDYTPPTTISTEQECKIVATAPDGTTCDCVIDLTLTCEPEQGAANPTIDCELSTCEVTDLAGNVITGPLTPGESYKVCVTPIISSPDGPLPYIVDPNTEYDFPPFDFLPKFVNATYVGPTVIQFNNLSAAGTNREVENICYQFTADAATGAFSPCAEFFNCPADWCTWGEVVRAIDCNADCLIPGTGLAIGTESTIFVDLRDNLGDIIDTGAVFSFVGATLGAVSYNAATEQWEIALTPTAEDIIGSVTTALGDCPDFCELNAGDTGDIDCDVTCVATPPLRVGTISRIDMTVTTIAGDPVTGLTVTPSNAQLVSAPMFDAANNVWYFQVRPTASPVSYSIVTDQGNCADICEAEAEIAANGINCETICCNIPDKGLVIGQKSVLTFKVMDVDGALITESLAFSFVGATICAPPVYDANTELWDVMIIPTAENIIPTIVDMNGSMCEAFCTITATESEVVTCCKLVTATCLPPVIKGVAYTGSVTFEDNAATTAVGLPAGLSYVNGTISGTTTADAGEVEITITQGAANEETGCPPLRIKMLVLDTEPDIGAGGEAPCPDIERVSAPTGTVGESYAGFVTFSGDNGPRVYTADPATLPPGITIVSATGQITGTPTTPGNYNIRVTVTDDETSCEHTINLLVEPAVVEKTVCPRVVSMPKLVATVGDAVSVQLVAENEDGTAATVTPQIIAPGLMLSASGLITGTPTEAGTSSFSVTFSEECTQTFVFCVLPETEECPEVEPVVTCSMQTIPVCLNQEVGVQMQAKDAAGAVVAWTGTGSLPPGVSFADGSFTGAPTATGVFMYTATPEGGNATMFIFHVRDCCPEDCPVVETKPQHHGHHHHPQPPQGNCRCVRIIATDVMVNGETYNGTLESPTGEIQVSVEDFYRLLENAQAIACC